MLQFVITEEPVGALNQKGKMNMLSSYLFFIICLFLNIVHADTRMIHVLGCHILHIRTFVSSCRNSLGCVHALP